MHHTFTYTYVHYTLTFMYTYIHYTIPWTYLRRLKVIGTGTAGRVAVMRLFYLALPPSVFVGVCEGLRKRVVDQQPPAGDLSYDIKSKWERGWGYVDISLKGLYLGLYFC